MSILLKNVRVLDTNSPAHKKQVNILIKNGVITSLSGKSADEIYDLKGKSISCGFFDLNAHFNDPGYEHREDLQSGSEVAWSGGFTDICLIPATDPPIESKSDINYLVKNRVGLVDLHPIAATSESLKGENLTEMLDLYAAGAVGFSDGDYPLWNTELLLKALQYTQGIKAPIIQNARDLNISSNTQMNEGKFSTYLGLRGEPSISEELTIQRDIEVLKYSGGSLHFTKVSTAKGLELIKKAKKEGLSVTCDVSLHHLLFTDESIGDFDTIFKNTPPFRSNSDRKALIKGIKGGTVDAICSNHRPLDQESKQLEFDYADAGSISLQTFFSALMTISEDIPLEDLLQKVVNGPRKVLKKDEIKIDKGNVAKLAILDLDESWILNEQTNKSKSRNSPFWNKELKGRVMGVVNGEKMILSQ
ncbi:dihydroorotase [Ekhidna sp.]|uniref:dihydroorotase n=1 Tax=Ekhidna sp. TaxID=2608089 RepID=UPI003B50F92F